MVAVERGEFGEVLITCFPFLPAAPADTGGQDSADGPDDDRGQIQRSDRVESGQRGTGSRRARGENQVDR